MTLIVEDGTGRVDADAYCSQAFADAWHLARGITLWATMSSDEKDAAIRRATMYLVMAYRLRWLGVRVTTVQALDWPRYNVPRVDMLSSLGYGGPTYYENTDIPIEVKQANAELAFKAASGDLAEDIARLTKREKIDVIEVEYVDGSTPIVRYRSVDMLLAPLLKGGGASAISVERG